MPKKDYDRWCRGREGREHTLTVTKRTLGSLAECHAVGKQWVCGHVVVCSVCHRVLTHEWQMTPGQCPDHKL